MDRQDSVRINVGGRDFITRWSSLRKYPDTLLGSLTVKSEWFNETENKFYFDRNPELFNCILDFYRNDALHIHSNICPWLWKSEIMFWKLPENCLSECCFGTIAKYEKDRTTARVFDDVFMTPDSFVDKTSSKFSVLRQRLWVFLNEPDSSKSAKVFSVLYLVLVLISAMVPCLSTHPSIREATNNITIVKYSMKRMNNELWLNTDNRKEVLMATTKDPDWLTQLDISLNIFFTIEISLRIISCPSAVLFVKDWINILDVVLLVNLWTQYCIHQYDKIGLITKVSMANLFYITKVLSVFRLLRFLRLAKQYRGLQILLLSLKNSCKELLLLFITFLLFAWIFANLIYFAEVRESETFPNMLIGLWWSVITMTTVGYGDVYPVGDAGRIVGAICTMCGLLVLSMPIAVIAGTFDDLSKRKDEREAFIKLREELMEVKQQKDKKTNCNGIVPFDTHSCK